MYLANFSVLASSSSSFTPSSASPLSPPPLPSPSIPPSSPTPLPLHLLFLLLLLLLLLLFGMFCITPVCDFPALFQILERQEWGDLRGTLKKNKDYPRKCRRQFLRYCDENNDKTLSLDEWRDCLGLNRRFLLAGFCLPVCLPVCLSVLLYAYRPA